MMIVKYPKPIISYGRMSLIGAALLSLSACSGVDVDTPEEIWRDFTGAREDKQIVDGQRRQPLLNQNVSHARAPAQSRTVSQAASQPTQSNVPPAGQSAVQQEPGLLEQFQSWVKSEEPEPYSAEAQQAQPVTYAPRLAEPQRKSINDGASFLSRPVQPEPVTPIQPIATAKAHPSPYESDTVGVLLRNVKQPEPQSQPEPQAVPTKTIPWIGPQAQPVTPVQPVQPIAQPAAPLATQKPVEVAVSKPEADYPPVQSVPPVPGQLKAAQQAHSQVKQGLAQDHGQAGQTRQQLQQQIELEYQDSLRRQHQQSKGLQPLPPKQFSN